MKIPDGYRRCIRPRCRHLISERYAFTTCTPCAAKAAEKIRLACRRATARRLRALRKKCA